jgi:hypothetical protein
MIHRYHIALSVPRSIEEFSIYDPRPPLLSTRPLQSLFSSFQPPNKHRKRNPKTQNKNPLKKEKTIQLQRLPL